jgi:hypothetical protein
MFTKTHNGKAPVSPAEGKVSSAEGKASVSSVEGKAPAAEAKVPVPETWYSRLYTRNVAHAQAGEHARMWGQGLGIVAVVLSTVTGTALFTSLQDSPSANARLWVAIIALLAAVAAALNAFFNFNKRADDHHRASLRYEALRNELDEYLECGRVLTLDNLEGFRKRWHKVEKEAPILPRGRYRKARRDVENQLEQRAKALRVQAG